MILRGKKASPNGAPKGVAIQVFGVYKLLKTSVLNDQRKIKWDIWVTIIIEPTPVIGARLGTKKVVKLFTIYVVF